MKSGLIHLLNDQYRYLDPSGWLSDCQGIELDIGCGKGRFLLDLAQRYPHRLCIGVDVMLGRLRKVSRKAERNGLSNIVLLRVDAWHLLKMLSDASLDRVHIRCPDPWPKKRHRHRRLISSEFIGRLATKMKHGGSVYMSTDDTAYFRAFTQTAAALAAYRFCRSPLHDTVASKSDFESYFEAQGRRIHQLFLQCIE